MRQYVSKSNLSIMKNKLLINDYYNYICLFLMETEIIRHRGYPVETHSVTTEDGYVLESHRIPPRLNNNKKRQTCVSHEWFSRLRCYVVNDIPIIFRCDYHSNQLLIVNIGGLRPSVKSNALVLISIL